MWPPWSRRSGPEFRTSVLKHGSNFAIFSSSVGAASAGVNNQAPLATCQSKPSLVFLQSQALDQCWAVTRFRVIEPPVLFSENRNRSRIWFQELVPEEDLEPNFLWIGSGFPISSKVKNCKIPALRIQSELLNGDNRRLATSSYVTAAPPVIQSQLFAAESKFPNLGTWSCSSRALASAQNPSSGNGHDLHLLFQSRNQGRGSIRPPCTRSCICFPEQKPRTSKYMTPMRARRATCAVRRERQWDKRTWHWDLASSSGTWHWHLRLGPYI